MGEWVLSWVWSPSLAILPDVSVECQLRQDEGTPNVSLCGSLREKYPPQAQAFEHLVP